MGIDRVYNNDNAPDSWIASDDYESYQGRGSWIMMDNPDLLAALRVAFVDTVTGQIYGMAKADQDGWLHLINDENSAIIRPLDTHVITPITVWIYLDGDLVQNAHAGSVDCTDLEINLQFSTDTVLYPAYSGDNETPNMPFNPSVPSEPSTPDTPDTPDVPAPSIPTEQTDFYLEHDGSDQYSFYTLNADGSREYELTFTGSMDTDSHTVIVDEVTEYPNGGVVIPALATYTADSEEYSVSIDPTAPFADLGSENATIFILPIDGEKVGITSTDLSDMFVRNSGTDFVSLDLSGLDTSIATDMSYMFYNCSNLTELDVTGFDTSNVTTMFAMFYECSGLTELSVRGFDTANVTNMEHMFIGCSSLSELDVSDFDTSNVTSMFQMFYGCSNLTELDVSSFDIANVINAKCMFYGCSSLTELDVSGFDTSKVADMSFMFSGCSGLTELDVSNFNTANVVDIQAMFQNCSGLTELDVSGFDTSNVTNMSHMFYLCSSLTKLDVSEFDTSNVTDMSWMFGQCSSLTELDISGFDTANVTNMNFMFWNCSRLTELNLSNFNTGNVTDMASMFAECTSLTELNVSGFSTANVTDMSYIFDSCSNLTELDVNGFNTSNVTNMGSMFSRCSNLTELDVSGFDTANVTDMSSMFYYCSGLAELDVSGFDTSNVTSLSCMFDGCSNLTELDVSGFDTSSVTNMSWMFNRCSSLAELDLSSFDTSKVEDTTGFFIYFTNLQTIVTPKKMGNASIALPGSYLCEANGNTYTVIDKTVPAQAVLTKSGSDTPIVVDGGDVTESITWTLYDNGLLRFEGTGAMPNYSGTSDIPWYDHRDEIISVELADGITYLGRGNLVYIDYEQITIPESVVAIAIPNTWPGHTKTVYYAGSERQWSSIAIHNDNSFGFSIGLDESSFIAGKPDADLRQSGHITSTDISWTLYNDGVLMIDGSGEMPDWSEADLSPWSDYGDDIISVVISGSVSNIGSYAFANMDGLQSVRVGPAVTNIGAYAFNECSNLLSVAFDQDSVLQEVGEYAFRLCVNLRYITLPDTTTTLGESAFVDCRALTYVTIDGVRVLGDTVFHCCESLSSIILPEGIYEIPYGTFARCFSLTSVTIPSTVMKIESFAFLAEHDDPFTVYYTGSSEQWDLITIEHQNTYLDNAEFHFQCKTVDSGSVNESISWMLNDAGTLSFYGTGEMPYSGLTPTWSYLDFQTVIIYDGITSICDYAFVNAENLSTVILTPSITDISWYAFNGCDSPITIYVLGGESEFDLTSWSGTQPDNITFHFTY
jgi:surface protein